MKRILPLVLAVCAICSACGEDDEDESLLALKVIRTNERIEVTATVTNILDQTVTFLEGCQAWAVDFQMIAVNTGEVLFPPECGAITYCGDDDLRLAPGDSLQRVFRMDGNHYVPVGRPYYSNCVAKPLPAGKYELVARFDYRFDYRGSPPETASQHFYFTWP